MKYNQWTLGLAAAGVVSLASVAQAEEAKSAVQTALSHTTISGYVDTSAIWRFGTGNGTIPGRSFDGTGPFPGQNKQDGFNLNVVKLTIEKPIDEGQWSAGYKVDLLYGPDANRFNSSSVGLTGQDFAIKQAYVALRAPVGNGIDFKMGVWDSIVGYEVFEAGNNPNYSRSYGHFLEPWAHTGLLASYRISDLVAVSGGVAQTTPAVGSAGVLPLFSNTINARGTSVESVKSYMGSVALTAPESWGFLKGSTLYGGVVDSAATVGGRGDVLNLYVGATLATPVAGLSLGGAFDYVANAVSNGSYANAYALYASFAATDKLRLNVRGEYTSASAGTYTGVKFGSGSNEEFLSATATVDYSLWANVISRVEFRWDHDASGGPGSINVGSTSGGTSGLKNVASVALNLIYKF